MREIPDNICNCLKYDEKSPSKLVWNTSRLCGKGDKVVNIGDPAGYKHNGYYYVEVNGEVFSAHRLVYELVVGKIPVGFVIDHKNKDKSDNTYTNLEPKLQIYNIRNQGKRKTNTSGVTGVFLEKHRNGTMYWVALWNDPVTHKQLKKRYRVDVYGDKQAFYLACEFRAETLRGLIENHGYSESHGK